MSKNENQKIQVTNFSQKNKKEEEDEDEYDENEKEVVKKYKKIKKKFIYSVKDDLKFMLLPKENMISNFYLYFFIFIILTTISIISDIFSMIISCYGGQIFLAIIAILLRLIFISSYIITIKYEFEFILIVHLIINNCLFCYSVLFLFYLNIYHKAYLSGNFIWFCIFLYYISILCNFINIIVL